MRALVVVPFVLPTVVVALAFLAVLPDGLERGWIAILIAHAFFNVAVVVLVVSTFWASLDRRTSEVAATLGAPRAQLPRDHPPAARSLSRGCGSIVFLFSFTSFGVVLILGGPAYSTIEAEIYNQAVRIFDLRAAAILSVVQLICVGVAVWITLKLEAVAAVGAGPRSERDVLRKPRTSARRGLVGGSLGLLAVFLGVPLAVLVERSIAVGDGYGLDAYRALARPTSASSPHRGKRSGTRSCTQPLRRSSRSSSEVSPPFAVANSTGPRALDVLLMLPLGASAVMLGFGFVIAFDRAPIDFRAAPWIVPVVQALVALPFVVRIVAPTLASDRPTPARGRRDARRLAGTGAPRDRPAHRRSGAGGGRRFRVRHLARRVRRDRLFLARPDTPTLPVAIFRFLGRPGEINAAQAYALAVVLMALTATSIFAVGRLRVGRGWV